MVNIPQATQQVEGYSAEALPAEILQSDQPVILKGLVKHWPVVQAGIAGAEHAIEYIRAFDGGRPVDVYYGAADIAGRFFYTSDFSGRNFYTQATPLSEVLEQILMHKDDAKPPAFYVGTASVDLYLPGFRQENDLDLGHLKPLISIWMGNQSRIAAHWDGMTNIACCVAGHRRFTLFPPDQIANLYPGPFDFTPAGQVVSMVDFADPDFDRFPKFEAAIAAGQVADLEPGDALLLPSMWWHHVEGLSCFNALVNYWWRAAPPYTGPGIAVLEHALLALRDLPMPEKRAWKNLFDYYVFSPKAQASDHIPETARGVLALDDMKARRLRAKLINKLNR